eukprot:Opistho-2@43189
MHQDFLDCKRSQHDVVLWNKSNDFSIVENLVSLAVNVQAAARSLELSTQNVEKSRFSGARGAKHARNLSVQQLPRDTTQEDLFGRRFLEYAGRLSQRIPEVFKPEIDRNHAFQRVVLCSWRFRIDNDGRVGTLGFLVDASLGTHKHANLAEKGARSPIRRACSKDEQEEGEENDHNNVAEYSGEKDVAGRLGIANVHSITLMRCYASLGAKLTRLAWKWIKVALIRTIVSTRTSKTVGVIVTCRAVKSLGTHAERDLHSLTKLADLVEGVYRWVAHASCSRGRRQSIPPVILKRDGRAI